MRKMALFILLFFLNSCSFNTLFLSEEIDTVTVVKYTPYMKHHRAYFSRSQLKPLIRNYKYRFVYHTKKQELSILLHRKNQYILYNFTKPNTPAIAINASKKRRYKDVLKLLRRKGYITKNIYALGYFPTVALRRYKGVKTLMVEVKDYRRLQKRYRRAISTYNAQEIKSIDTVLPKNLIYAHYENYRKRAKTDKQLAQLQIIANKLNFNSNIIKKKYTQKKVKESNTAKNKSTTPKKITMKKEKKVKDIKQAIQKTTTPIKKSDKGYSYYRYHALYNELRRYLAKNETKSSLSYTQYKSLEKHAQTLKEEKLLSTGSLEALIAAYKINKSPKYKQRIMLLMKEKQKDK